MLQNMRRGSFVLSIFFGCGSHAATAPNTDAAIVVSPACMTARDARTKAAELEAAGHEVLALAKVEEANAACPAERASSSAVEAIAQANAGTCAQARLLAVAIDGGATNVAAVKAICDARDALPLGTEQTMRAKLREAYAAEHSKDFPRAKALYLDAWSEHHPMPLALEDAARMAARAGDAADARRLRDRALVEAEASEHAVAEVTDRVRVVRGSPLLRDNTLVLGREGKVVARDLASGDVRVLLDAKDGQTTLSPYGTIALAAPANTDLHTLSVYDLLTGKLLFKLNDVERFGISPDDTRIVVRDALPDGAKAAGVRVIDVATGEVHAKLAGESRIGFVDLVTFAPDASHVLLFGDGDATVYRQWDVDKSTYTSMRLQTAYGLAALSADAHYLAYIEGPGESSPLHVYDMVLNKEVTQWTGRFITLDALAISLDGKTVATGSYNSLRLWDVAQKKQIVKLDRSSPESHNSHDFTFSDDGRMVAGYTTASVWDAAGKATLLVGAQPVKNLSRVIAHDGGAAFVLKDEVRIVPATGESRTVCKGMTPLYFATIGPTNAAYSTSGKSFACSMTDGYVHVFDTATWTEHAVVKKGAKAPAERPVDLVFSADEKSISVVSDANIVTYDAQTAAETARVAFKHPSLGLAPRHWRLSDGTIAVRLWNGSAALFAADGKYQRDMKLVAGAAIEAVDEMSADGKAYAVAIGKTLHIVDIVAGVDRTVELASAAKSVTIAADGTFVIAGADGVVSTLAGTTLAPLASASHGSRVWSLGKSIAVLTAQDTIEIHPATGAPTTMEIDPDGLVVRDALGAFEARGKPELECIVGHTFLMRETCADRAKTGLIESWTRSAQ